MRLAIVMVVTRLLDVEDPRDEQHKAEGIQLVAQSVKDDPTSYMMQAPDPHLTASIISVAVQEIKPAMGEPN